MTGKNGVMARGPVLLNPRRALSLEIVALIKKETAEFTSEFVAVKRRELPRDRPKWSYKASLAARQMGTYIAWVTCDVRRETVAQTFGYDSNSAVSIVVKLFEEYRAKDPKLDAFFSQLEDKIFALRRHNNVATVL